MAVATSSSGCTAASPTPASGDTRIYHFLGWAVALAYFPLYLYRTRIEDPKYADEVPDATAPAAGE